MREHTGIVLFYVVSIAFLLGVAFGSQFNFSPATIVWWCLISFGVVVLWSRRSEAPSAPFVKIFSLSLIAFSLGVFRIDYAAIQSESKYLENRVDSQIELVGEVVRERDERTSYVGLYVKTEYGLLLARADTYEVVDYGDKINISGVLEKPDAFETDLGRIFNYPGYLKAKGVTYVVSYAEVEVLDIGFGNPVVSKLLAGKKLFIEKIESLMPEPQVGLGEGLLLGVKRALGEELETAFRRTGIIHIVVLSGYNIMLVVLFISYILGRFFNVRWRSLFGLVGIITFALTVGLSATVVRASLMASLLLVATLTNRSYLVLRALVLAGIIMVLHNPYVLLFDPGFQLSFMATLGLILAISKVEDWFSAVPNKWLQVRSFLAATVVTQIFVLPLLLYQIGEISLVSVIVNVLVLPMVPVSMLLTFLTGLIGFLSPTLAMPLAYLTNLSLNYIINIASFFSTLPYASVSVPPFPLWFMFLLYGLLAVVIWHVYKREINKDSLLDWKVVDEEMVKTTKPQAQGPAAEETPIFFR